MTTEELLKKFNDDFGISENWPVSYKVDLETYKNVLYSIYENRLKYVHLQIVSISIGKTGGLLFKNVELFIG